MIQLCMHKKYANFVKMTWIQNHILLYIIFQKIKEGEKKDEGEVLYCNAVQATGVNFVSCELWRGSRAKASVARAVCPCSHVPNSLALPCSHWFPFISPKEHLILTSRTHTHTLALALWNHTTQISGRQHNEAKNTKQVGGWEWVNDSGGGFVLTFFLFVIPLQLNLHFSLTFASQIEI